MGLGIKRKIIILLETDPSTKVDRTVAHVIQAVPNSIHVRLEMNFTIDLARSFVCHFKGVLFARSVKENAVYRPPFISRFLTVMLNFSV